jgi:hypothetical protein
MSEIQRIQLTFLELPNGKSVVPDVKTAYEFVGVLASSSFSIAKYIQFGVHRCPAGAAVKIYVDADRDLAFNKEAAENMLRKYSETGKAEG